MTFDDIKQEIEANGGVKTFAMEDLRSAAEAGRLGVHVRNTISQTLAGFGIGHVPINLPNSQAEPVRLYKRGTPVGNLIETVLNPGEARDDELVSRTTTSGPDYASVITEIKDLVANV